MKKISLLAGILLLLAQGAVVAQNKGTGKNQWLDLGLTAGSSQGSFSFSYNYGWRLGQKQKWELGVGARLTNYIGTKKDFLTAGPAKYTRSFTAPFLIFFAGQQEANFDTLTVQRPLTNSVNAQVLVGYHISPKWYAGFNIDVIGFTIGRKTSGIYTSNGITTTDPGVKPTTFNLLLTGDHDKGTLNSEFFLGYQLNKKIRLRAIYQFIFVEYKSQSFKQSLPDGVKNDRFRNKANNVGIGISYFLN